MEDVEAWRLSGCKMMFQVKLSHLFPHKIVLSDTSYNKQGTEIKFRRLAALSTLSKSWDIFSLSDVY